MTQSTTYHDKSSKQNDSQSLNTLCFVTTGSATQNMPTYWIQFDQSTTDKEFLIERLDRVLVDQNFQKGLVASNQDRKAWAKSWKEQGVRYWAEKQFKPGVTDNLAKTIEEALRLMKVPSTVKVSSGATYLLTEDEAKELKVNSENDLVNRASYNWYHPLVENFQVHDLDSQSIKNLLEFPQVMLSNPKGVEEINMDISDEDLLKLSKNRLLALNLEEMREIKKHYKSKAVKNIRAKNNLPFNPTDVELEIIAQTWSEHCKHKIFNARINYTETNDKGDEKKDAPHHQVINSLYKTYIKGATRKLKPKRPDLLSVFEDNSGIVKWNDEYGVCFKVETHNSPSALEPYGGALTGILGVNRDILGTGLGAKPIFNTDVFCFASPNSKNLAKRPKLLPPETITSGVRKGVEDGGNKSGIPTVNGAIVFHDGYRAKPLVFCGTGGILPLELNNLDHVFKHTKKGDRILVAGGRVGKDGIHGATFSSESLNESSPVTAVQIGDPFTQKRVIDFVLEAQKQGLITGITDNGAGGLSSSVGEMATITDGATIDLAKVPLKYPGLSDWEIIISESQERMTISTDKSAQLTKLAESFDVEISDIGQFDDQGYFKITKDESIVALIDLEFLHKGLPTLDLKAEWSASPINEKVEVSEPDTKGKIFELLSHENIASREDVVRQYDHEVQGQSVIKPLMGKEQNAPCDAAVLLPLLDKKEALVVSNGICPQWSQFDPYLMAQLAVDEAVRNGICVGADPNSFSLLDNFCWPDPVESKNNPDGAFKLGQLVRTCQGLFDACVAYNAPLISGKDSMKNNFDDGTVKLAVPPTLLISAIARMEDAHLAITSDFKRPGDPIYLLSAGSLSLTGSHYQELFGGGSTFLPKVDLSTAHKMYREIHKQITKGNLRSAHDLSEGGLAITLCESALGGNLGVDLDLTELVENNKDLDDSEKFALFAEGPSSIVVSIARDKKQEFISSFGNSSTFNCTFLGQVSQSKELSIKSKGTTIASISMEELNSFYNKKLPMEIPQKQ